MSKISSVLRVTDEQWDRIRMHFPEESIPGDQPGRKPAQACNVLDAVRWILNTGAQWHMLPEYYPAHFLGFVQPAALCLPLKQF